ncbi:MAG: hypothetical protein ACYS74_05975 [Planctomycetota bacterium]|jgi:hypothetical protein
MTRKLCDKFRGSLYLILSLLLSIYLASCYPEFKNPIPPPPEPKADHQILGTWIRTTDESGSKEQLSIFHRSSGWIDVVLINEIAFVNRQKFLCLRFRKRDFSHRDREAQEFHFYIVNYETPSKDKLVVKHFSIRKVKELIKEGKLEGVVVKQQGQYYDDVTVTSSSDELVKVISKEGVGAFIEQDKDDILVFSRSKT